ncbi:unnamed protein product [Heterobilharzia americana]|nr:unnamed protein product [Heterobilharzia americana]
MNANEIYETVVDCLNKCVEELNEKRRSIQDIIGIGITNQRETTIAWDRETGKPLAPAIVWSDARTADDVVKFIQLAPESKPNAFQHITGLPIHSYFSAVKMNWLLSHIEAVIKANEDNRLLFGTVDSWLVWKLTNHACHVTDVTNASRTLLFNLHTLEWDEKLCQFFHINPRTLPNVISSAELVGVIQDTNCLMKTWTSLTSVDDSLSDISGVKITYGTGAFMLWNIGSQPFFSDKGVLTTIAYQIGPKAKPHYALEGAVSYAGATMKWLKTKLEVFKDYENLRNWLHLFSKNKTNISKADLIYAGLRSSVYQTYDVMLVATLAQTDRRRHSHTPLITLEKPKEIIVDGGMSNSSVLMQSLADVLNMTVKRHNHSNVMTALGVAIVVALTLKIDPSGLLKLRQYTDEQDQQQSIFHPRIDSKHRDIMLTGWYASVKRSLNWTIDEQEITSKSTFFNLLKHIYNEQSLNEDNMVKKQRFPLKSVEKFSIGVAAIGLLILGILIGRRIR